MNFEKVFYEARPVIYLVMGALAFFNASGSRLLLACGFLLLFCGSLVLSYRAASRKLEPVLYDIRPYAYLAGAGLTLYFYKDSRLGFVSALVLLFCATLIIRWRNKE